MGVLCSSCELSAMHKMVSRGMLELGMTLRAGVETSRRLRGLETTIVYPTPSLSALAP
jgi:hypothetical protein